MGTRKRIKRGFVEGSGVIEDTLEYKRNRSTERARKIENTSVKIIFDIHCDQHYFNRRQFGDDVGKRVGIELEDVKKLATESIKHLIYYGSRVKNFTFVASDEKTGTINRIVLQQEVNGEMLNVVIETHFINLDEYELTIITAMKTNDFKITNGQYVLELFPDNGSILKKQESNKLTLVLEV